MAEDEILIGTLWMLAHWLLPAKATKEDALTLIDKAEGGLQDRPGIQG